MGDELTMVETLNILEDMSDQLYFSVDWEAMPESEAEELVHKKVKALDYAMRIIRSCSEMEYHFDSIRTMFRGPEPMPLLSEAERRARDEAFRNKCEANRNMYGVPVKGSLADGYDVIKVGGRD
jgi:hypothetical protein